MSLAHASQADSGHNHVRPLVFAVAIAVVTLLVSLAFTGLPH
jgi:hypothetical protein